MTEGWASPSPNGLLHYYDKTGKSLCNRWVYMGQDMVDKRPQWNEIPEDEEDWKKILDPDFCQDCQLKYEGGGRQKPGSPLPRCESCGRFCVGYAYMEWDWYSESAVEVFRCKECARSGDIRGRDDGAEEQKGDDETDQ